MNSETLLEKTSLSSRAMLAGLSLHQWAARKFDKKASQKINADNNAKQGSARANKDLIGEGIKPVRTAFNSIRSAHLEMTSPWIDKGPRILSSELYFDYQKTLGDLIAEAESVADQFAADYPALYEERKADMTGMGQLFNPFDYPSPQEIRAKFRIERSIIPLPDDGDFRVELPDHVVASIASDYGDRHSTVESDAVQDMFKRADKVVRNMAERLGAFHIDEQGKTQNPLRDSLVGNVQELAALLPKLNCFGDPRIDSLATDMADKLSQHSAQDLRESETLRNSVRQEASNILEAMPY